MVSATIQGRLGRDPELRHTASGTAVLNFSVACDRSYPRDAPPTWVNVSLFGKAAEAMHPHLSKGDGVFVTGELYLRKYESNDGTQGESLDMNADTVRFGIGSPLAKGQENRQDAPAPNTENDPTIDW